MKSRLEQLSVYFPQHQGRAVKAQAVAKHGSVSRYLRHLIEQDQPGRQAQSLAEIGKINARLDELFEFMRYSTVLQNGVADRLSPGLLEHIQGVYTEQFGSTPNAR